MAFVRIGVNDKKDGYESSIWSVGTSGSETAHSLTTAHHDASPRWSPDGRFLLFVRPVRVGDKPEVPQLWLLPMSGGDAYPITHLPRGVSGPQWSPDGHLIAFMSDTNADDLARQHKQERPGGSGEGDADRQSDVRVITRAEYRSNDEGYLDPKHPQHVWVLAAPHAADEHTNPQPLTRGPFEDENIAWAADSSRLYFTTNPQLETYYELPRSELRSVPAGGGEPTQIASIDMGVQSLSPSPDGRRLAFIAASERPVRSYAQPDLWVIDASAGARPRNLTATFDWDVGAGVLGDNGAPRAGGGSRPLWTADGAAILEIYTREGRTQLARFDSSTGAETDLTRGDQAVINFRAAGGKLVYTLSTPTRINDLFVLDTAAPEKPPVQLTHVNDPLFDTLSLAVPQEISYRSFDGRRIQAWILKPLDFDPRRKYPLILDIHGGPHTAYGYIFEHEFQWMAAKGYVVLYPNPRGSTSYGQDFGNVIQYHYPGDDFRDLMAGVDEVIRRGYVDPARLGVTGGSGGGLLTNWTVGHTTRFAAAVAQRDIADWADWWYSADILFFHPNWFRAPPFEDPQDYRARSPITYIRNVKTPLMLVLGDADTRTPRARAASRCSVRSSIDTCRPSWCASPARPTSCRARASRGTASSGCSTSSAGSITGCSALPNRNTIRPTTRPAPEAMR